MLVLCKILRLFVKTLTDDEKYSVLYRDILAQPIQILLSQKQQTFSLFCYTFLKSTLNFASFHKKDDPHSGCFSQITVSEKGHSINVCKIPFKRSLPQKTRQKGPKTVEICTTLSLRYFCIPLKIIQLEEVYVSPMQILQFVCQDID